MIKIEIDGNDGVGKSTLIAALNDVFDNKIEIKDRGSLTKATDSGVFDFDKKTIYILLDCDVETCQKRILNRGDSIDVKYHTKEDLTYYRKRFIEIAEKNNIKIIKDYDFKKDFETILNYINKQLWLKRL